MNVKGAIENLRQHVTEEMKKNNCPRKRKQILHTLLEIKRTISSEFEDELNDLFNIINEVSLIKE